MYEQVSHSLLNEILDRLKPEIRRQDLRHFYTRLGANFYAIYGLFHLLYGHRGDFREQMLRLVEVMADQYITRADALERTDKERERDHNWFLSPQWVGMALYSEGFATDLNGVKSKLPYLQELGVNMVHLMPILRCPEGASDGGYAVSDFRQISPRIGKLEDITARANASTRTTTTCSTTATCPTCSRRPCPRSSPRPRPAPSPGTRRWASGS